MLGRISLGTVPPKPHLVFRGGPGPAGLRYEECITRAGFDGAFSILYHDHRPHEALPVHAERRFVVPRAAPATGEQELLRRHYHCLDLPSPSGAATVNSGADGADGADGAGGAGGTGGTGGSAAIDCRIPLLFNQHVVLGFLRPSGPDPVYFVNADADDLFFILHGSGLLRSTLGDLIFAQGDYVCVPKGIIHRLVPDPGVAQAWLSIECKAGLGLPAHYRNALGQLKMDAPYSHRDFHLPTFVGPVEESIRDVVVKRDDSFFGFRYAHTPLDVVGWDGAVYPFALPILAFQPRVGQVHLPPPVHATFDANGTLICSFVPRPLDFHRDANPCPYPHSSVDVDEVLFYANDAFASRRGITAGSLSHHPAGIPHGPHPGAYENAPGQTHTDEIAVMLDCAAHLRATTEARAIEVAGYHRSFET